MNSVCHNCVRERTLSVLRYASQSNDRWLPRFLKRWSSTLPFSSDRHPEDADRVPIHKYISNKHKRKNIAFVCGLNTTGALGIPKLPLRNNFPYSKKTGYLNYPYRLALGELKVTTLDCGYGFTVIGSNNNDLIKVWGTGINTESQLGFHNSRKTPSKKTPEVSGYFGFLMEPAPIPIPFDNYSKTKVVQVACGRAHTLILTDNEGIYTFGNNAFGQCGRRIVEGEIYEGSRKIHQIPHSHFSSPVTQVACGMDHSLFLTKKGRVYACGWGADGQTGLGSYEKTGTPTLVKGDLEGVEVKKVTTFADMSMAIGEDGSLYGWGNSEYHQLASVTEDTQVCTPMKLPFKKSGKIIDVAAGGSICCVLNENGEVWVWGYGILGKGPDLMDTKYPRKIPMTLFGESVFTSGVKVTKVKCGMHHFAAVTNRGELYTWGKNKSGCLGIGDNRDQYFPWKILLPGEAHDVHCGVDHTVIVSKSLL